MVGVISHVPNPDAGQAVGLAQAAEGAGAQWVGVADAFWWRDVWLLLGEVASATERIELGPAMTNPYLRHRFHTASALATLHEMAPGRVFCGIAAGGSELTAAAGISRRDAPAKVTEPSCARSPPAGHSMRRRAAVSTSTSIPSRLMAGRADQMLRTAGAMADRVLLWAIPASELERSASIVHDGAAHRPRPPELIWAPLVRHGDAPQASIQHVAVYASLNTAAAVRHRWGLDDTRVEAARRARTRRSAAGALSRPPRSRTAGAMADRVLLWAIPVAVPGFDPTTVRDPRLT